ncbi:hypothetical protein ACHAXS_012261 [Conticribra weissflogii]
MTQQFPRTFIMNTTTSHLHSSGTRRHARRHRNAHHRGAHRVPSSLRGLQQGHRTRHPPLGRSPRRVSLLLRDPRPHHRRIGVEPRAQGIRRPRGRFRFPGAQRGLLPRRRRVRPPRLEALRPRGIRHLGHQGASERTPCHVGSRRHDRPGIDQRRGDLRQPRPCAR